MGSPAYTLCLSADPFSFVVYLLGVVNFVQISRFSLQNRMQNLRSNNHKNKQQTLYIKLPMYLFFIWCLDVMILMRANPLQGPLEGVGPENHYVSRHVNNRYKNNYFAIYLSLCSQPIHMAVPCTSGGERSGIKMIKMSLTCQLKMHLDYRKKN